MIVLLPLVSFVISCSEERQVAHLESLIPPSHPQIPSERERFGIVISDEYAWMNDIESFEFETSIDQETRYARAALKTFEPLTQLLQQEMNNRLPTTTVASVVVDDVTYRREIRPGFQYAFHTRQSINQDSADLLLNENLRAADHKYYHLRNWSLNPKGDTLVVAEDLSGDEYYRLSLINVVDGSHMCCEIPDTNGDVAWDTSGDRLYFIQRDPVTARPFRVVMREGGKTRVLHTEDNPEFALSLRESRSRQFLLVTSTSSTGNRVFKIDRDNPAPPVEVLGYELGISHQLIHLKEEGGGRWFRLTRSRSEDRLRHRADGEQWRDALPDSVKATRAALVDFEVYPRHLVLHYREHAQETITLVDRQTGSVQYVPEVVPLQTLRLRRSLYDEDAMYETTNSMLRYELSHPLSPPVLMRYDIRDRAQSISVAHQQDLNELQRYYHGEVKFLAARDGAMIPVSLLYRPDRFEEGRSPLLMNVYGAYGAPLNTGFRVGWRDLLDRGFVIAMAHVRGGGAGGRDWHRRGSGVDKGISITDFLDVIHALIEQRYGDPQRVFAQGTSAAGVVIGASVNQAPDLFKGIVLNRPFVDLVNTLLDENRPLTLGEYREWGDPMTLGGLEQVLSYSPYDTVRESVLPAMLIRSAALDQRVLTSEHLRWVAKLRDHNTGNMPIVMTVDHAGHRGVSDRHDRYQQLAEAYAFMITLADLH